MSNRTFVTRHRSTASVVAAALAVVGLAGFGTVAGQERGEGSQSLAGAPYGIGEAPPVADETTTPTPSESVRPDRRGRQQPWPTQRGGAAQNIDRGVRMRSAPGVVLIDTAMNGGEGMGTGMVLTDDGQVLTNYHVVQGSEKVSVTVADSGRTYNARLLGADAERDVALLQLDGADKLATVTVSEAAARLGDTVYAVGNGNGQGFLTRLDGKVTGVNRSIDVSEGVMFGPTVKLDDLIETDADVVPGYSGGPLLDAGGEVIGLTTAASFGRSIDGYATPIDKAMSVVEQVRSGEESGGVRIGPKGALGVQVATDPQVSGGVVVGLPSDSAAAGVGIARGDVITAIDGERVTSAARLADAVGSREPGTEVSVTWQTTDGRSRTATVTLGTSPVN